MKMKATGRNDNVKSKSEKVLLVGNGKEKILQH